MLLKEIQSLEDKLIYSDNCGSNSTIFTEMMYKTNEWVDKEYNAKSVHISPYKVELDKQIELVAYYITCGETTDNAFLLAGLNRHSIQAKMTDTHHNILLAARKERTINRNKNK